MSRMVEFEDAKRTEKSREVHKYCSLVHVINIGNTNEGHVSASDIRNLMLHMADF